MAPRPHRKVVGVRAPEATRGGGRSRPGGAATRALAGRIGRDDSEAMISAEAFALANLVIWTVVLVALAIAERRGRSSYITRHRGIRYRRLSTADALKRIRKS